MKIKSGTRPIGAKVGAIKKRNISLRVLFELALLFDCTAGGVWEEPTMGRRGSGRLQNEHYSLRNWSGEADNDGPVRGG